MIFQRTDLGERRHPLTEDYCLTSRHMYPETPCPYHVDCPRDISLPVRQATAHAIRETLRGMEGQ